MNPNLSKLIDCAKIARNLMTKKMEALDITCRQAMVLKYISENEKTIASDISRELLMDKATLSKIIMLLEKKEFIYKKSYYANKKNLYIFMTKKGEIAVNKITDIEENCCTDIFCELTDSELNKFGYLIDNIYNKMIIKMNELN